MSPGFRETSDDHEPKPPCCVGPRGGRSHMFGSNPDPDQPGWDPGQEPETREEPKKQRGRERAGAT